MAQKPLILKIGLDIFGLSGPEMAIFEELSRLFSESGHEIHLLIGPDAESGRDSALPAGPERQLYRDAYCRKHKLHLCLDAAVLCCRAAPEPFLLIPMKKQRKIAVIGGSFNPVTTGHIAMAEAILSALPEIEQVWLMPAYEHPFRKHQEYTAERIRMLRMVETPKIRYFGYEIENRLSGVTYETFSRLLKDPAYDSFDFYMVLGSDCVLDFDKKWRYNKELASTVKFIIMHRQGYPLDDYDGLLSRPPHILLKDILTPDISATIVRERIRAGLPITGLVPEPVEQFILKNRLFITLPVPETFPGCNVKSCEKPSVTVDVAICTLVDDTLKVLLVRRKHPPFAGDWAIPGGFLETGRSESLDKTAARQLEEKTGLRDIYCEQLKTYGDAERYPGMRVITTAYFALVPWERLEQQQIRPPEDGAEIRWFPLKNCRKITEQAGEQLAFDHALILQELLVRLQGKISYTPIAFELLPERFTWPDLRRVYEIVLDKQLDATNFKRKIRAMYRVRDLRPLQTGTGVGRPPNCLEFEGIKEMYI